MGRPKGSPNGMTAMGVLDHEAAPKLRAIETSFKDLKKDPVSGYMYSPSNTHGFTIAKKVQFVAIAQKMWPNLVAVCDEVGIHPNTFKVHRTLDAKFAQDILDIRDRRVDQVENTMFHFSGEKGNFMDRIAILRAYRGEIYNPKSTVDINHNITQQVAEHKRVTLLNVIDAEVISSSEETLNAETTEQPQIPGPHTAGADASPSSVARPTGNSFNGGEQVEPGTRDPLSALTDD